VLATFGVLLAKDLGALVVALVALALLGAAGWIAATRSGLARWLGAAGAIIALAGGVAGLILLDAVDELIAFAVASFTRRFPRPRSTCRT
jgi:hypothetical protein